VLIRQGNTVTSLTASEENFLFFGSTDINSSGAVAFGFFRDGVGIATADSEGVNIIADTAGGFSSISLAPAINDNGDVAFSASIEGGPSGLFVGGDPVNNLVIANGDPLFGSTISDLGFAFFRHGFNNRGQIAFQYGLANGQSGIAVATPVPEPSMAIPAFACSLFALAGRRRKNACS